MAEKLLELLEAAQYFEEILGGDSFPALKPDPVAYLYLEEKFGLLKSQTLMIGDSWVDVAFARNAGIPVWAIENRIGKFHYEGKDYPPDFLAADTPTIHEQLCKRPRR